MKKYLKYLIYIVIPIIAVFLCRVLKLAQGEKIEEIIGGIMLGIFLDIILCIIDIILCVINKSKTKKKFIWYINKMEDWVCKNILIKQ